jgi:hypothetical protein
MATPQHEHIPLLSNDQPVVYPSYGQDPNLQRSAGDIIFMRQKGGLSPVVFFLSGILTLIGASLIFNAASKDADSLGIISGFVEYHAVIFCVFWVFNFCGALFKFGHFFTVSAAGFIGVTNSFTSFYTLNNLSSMRSYSPANRLLAGMVLVMVGFGLSFWDGLATYCQSIPNRLKVRTSQFLFLILSGIFCTIGSYFMLSYVPTSQSTLQSASIAIFSFTLLLLSSIFQTSHLNSAAIFLIVCTTIESLPLYLELKGVVDKSSIIGLPFFWVQGFFTIAYAIIPLGYRASIMVPEPEEYI